MSNMLIISRLSDLTILPHYFSSSVAEREHGEVQVMLLNIEQGVGTQPNFIIALVEMILKRAQLCLVDGYDRTIYERIKFLFEDYMSTHRLSLSADPLNLDSTQMIYYRVTTETQMKNRAIELADTTKHLESDVINLIENENAWVTYARKRWTRAWEQYEAGMKYIEERSKKVSANTPDQVKLQ
jgi:hypothetical protein